MNLKNAVVSAAGAATATILAGCGLSPGDRVLPGATGTGDDGYEVTIQLADVGNLVTNSEVKVNDKTVGTVKSIELDGWNATIKVGILDTVRLPADAEARIGQKSLLGSEYVELSAPADAGDAETGDLLADGDLIPMARTGRYTDTEDLLATLSLWLNGGGLQNVQTITAELNKALAGNEDEARRLIENLDALVGGLDVQKKQIIAAISSVNDLSARLRAQKGKLGRALEQIPVGLGTLNRQRESLTSALSALDDLSTVTTRVVRTSGSNLNQELRDLQPVLREINKAAEVIPDALDIAGTILFPISEVPDVVKGDYVNASETVDLTTGALGRGLLPNTPVADVLDRLQTALQATDPLTGPLNDAINGLEGGPVTLPGLPPSSNGAKPSGTGDVEEPTDAPTSDAPATNPLASLLSGLLGGRG